MDAAVLGDRLPEVTQKPFLGPGSLSRSAGIERARKCMQGLRTCEMPSQYLLKGFRGFARGSAAVCDPNPPRPFARHRCHTVFLWHLICPQFAGSPGKCRSSLSGLETPGLLSPLSGLTPSLQDTVGFSSMTQELRGLLPDTSLQAETKG